MPIATLLIENAAYPAVSRTGDVIVYLAINGDIVRTDKERTETVVIWEAPTTSPFHQAFNPVVSNDGMLVVFEFAHGITSVSELYSMSAEDGSNLTALTAFGENNNNGTMQATFSPDDSQIVFSRDDFVAARYDLWIMDANGDNLSLFLTFGGTVFATDPNWGSDDVIVYLKKNGTTYTIRTINPDGSGDAELATDLVIVGTEIGHPVYSPNGTKIVLLQNIAGATSIVQMDSDGQNSTVVATSEQLDIGISFDDGEGIQFFPNGVEFLVTGGGRVQLSIPGLLTPTP